MVKLKFPTTIFVAIEKDVNGDAEWLNAQPSQNEIGVAIGEEQNIAEYKFVRVRTFKGVLKEI